MKKVKDEKTNYEKELSELMSNLPHIDCLKRCDDNKCDCIKDYIQYLRDNVKGEIDD